MGKFRPEEKIYLSIPGRKMSTRKQRNGKTK